MKSCVLMRLNPGLTESIFQLDTGDSLAEAKLETDEDLREIKVNPQIFLAELVSSTDGCVMLPKPLSALGSVEIISLLINGLR